MAAPSGSTAEPVAKAMATGAPGVKAAGGGGVGGGACRGGVGAVVAATHNQERQVGQVVDVILPEREQEIKKSFNKFEGFEDFNSTIFMHFSGRFC